MIQIPMVRSAAVYTSPAISTTTFSTFPATYLISGSVVLPQILLEQPRVLASNYDTTISVASTTQSGLKKSYSNEFLSKEADNEKERNFDRFINERVEEQIKKFKQEYQTKLDETIASASASRRSSARSSCESLNNVRDKSEERTEANCRCTCTCKCNGNCTCNHQKSSLLSSSSEVRVVCHKCHDYLKKELSLDDKIKRIRDELNLPGEQSCNRRLDSMHKYHEAMRHEDNYSRRCHEHHYHINEYPYKADLREKYEVNYIKPAIRSSRSLQRSKSALVQEPRSRPTSCKSRSPSARPPWKPTNVNDYSSTYEHRAALLTQQYKREKRGGCTAPYRMPKVLLQATQANYPSTSSICTQTLNKSDKTVQTSAARPTVYICQPSHSYGSKHEYFNTSYKKTEFLPCINNSSTSMTTHHSTTMQNVRPSTAFTYGNDASRSQPTATYYCQRISQPAAQTRKDCSTYYSSQPDSSNYYVTANAPKAVLTRTTRSNVCASSSANPTVNLMPIETTKHGAIYKNPSKNEIHYVSENARRSWNTNAGGLVKIHNAGTTVIHD